MSRKQAQDSDDEDLDHYEDQSGMSPRSITDFPCCLVFIAYVVGMVYIWIYSLENGDIRRLTHGFNYRGTLCGVDDVVADAPYLYWCSGPASAGGVPTSVNLKQPICVKSCPDATPHQLPCPQPSHITQTSDPNVAYPLSKVTETIVQEVALKDTYATTVFADRFCMPADLTLMKTMLEGDGPFAGQFAQLMSAAGSVRRAWGVLVGVAFASIVVGYVYLLLMKIFAKPLVWVTLILLCSTFLGGGAYCVATANNTSGRLAPAVTARLLAAAIPVVDANGDGLVSGPRHNLFESVAGENAHIISYVAGGLLLLCGVFVLVMLLCMREKIQIAVACVTEACNTMFAMPSLLLQPGVEVLTKVIVLGIMVYGFGWLLSCGELKQHVASIGGQEVHGVHRSFKYSEDQTYMILYYILGMFWFQEIFTAMGQFVVSYSTVLYYFCPKDASGNKRAPWMPLLRGYGVGFVFHIGTIAFGALIIAIIRLVRVILMYIAKQAQADGNAVLAMVAKCLICVVTCVKSCMEFLNKNAYMDVAIRSTWFCTAAKNALKMILSEAAMMALLNGACFVFQIAGAGLIAGVGGFMTWTTVTGYHRYNDDTSDLYVDNVPAATVAGTLVALLIAIPFMITFDMCADTLLYCFMVDRSRSSGSDDYCPDGLAAVIRKAGK